MANAAFDPFKEGIIAGEIDLDTAVIKASFVRGYTFSSVHKFVSDVTGAGGTINGTSAALASKTITNGVFDAVHDHAPAVRRTRRLGVEPKDDHGVIPSEL